LAGVNIGNATDEYPKGDTIQVVEPWVPPDPWAELSTATVNAILDEIDRGLPNGQRFTNAPASSDERAAWKLVKQHCPDKTEGGCRKIIHEWLDNELLFARQYDDPVQRKPRSGLWVDNNRRPTGDDWSAGEEPDDEDEPL
jgi:hypothetical protein